MNSFDERTRRAIDDLYSVFAIYREPKTLEGSPHKDVAGMFRSLKAAPLRDLAPDQIGPYAGSAMLTVGGVAEYKHYLPRIVEHAALGAPYMGTDPPIIAGRVKLASWTGWPEGEQFALRAAFHTIWSWAVEQPPSQGPDASSWLCGMAILGEPIQPVLTDWAARSSQSALLQAACLSRIVETEFFENEVDLGYWSDVKPDVRQIIIEWVTSADRMDAFEAGLAVVGQGDRWEVEQALRFARERRRH
jgi:hypothetical protein